MRMMRSIYFGENIFWRKRNYGKRQRSCWNWCRSRGGAALGAKIGAGVGIAMGPLGAIAGTIPGAIIGGVIGGLTGNKIGSEIDRSEENYSSGKNEIKDRL